MKSDRRASSLFPSWIVLSLLCSTTFACQEVIDFDHSSCVFHIDYHDNTCTTFQFQECTWEEVSGFFFATSESHTSNNWSQCTNACCGQPHTAQTQSVLQECQSYLDDEQQQRTIIFWVFIAVILLLVILCICCKSKCGECCQKIREWCQGEEGGRSEEAAEQGSMSYISAGYGTGERNWKVVQQQNINFTNPCSVCLDDQPRFQLQCKHMFHRACILTWLNKKYECSLCRSRKIDQIRVYCEGCGQYYFDSSLRRIKSALDRKQFCNNCELIIEK